MSTITLTRTPAAVTVARSGDTRTVTVVTQPTPGATGAAGADGANATTFTDATARAAAVPDFVGQLGLQLDTLVLYRGTALTAGSWTALAAAAVGAEAADAAIQSHITGTGSPHTAAGVGAEAAGAVSSHAGLVDGTAHGDSGVADPAVSTLTVTGGAISVAVTTAARRFFADNGSATTLTVSAVTGLTNGGEPITLAVKTTGAGLTITWPGTPVTWGDAPTAAGEYCYLLWYNSSGVLNVLNPGDSG